ncbi:GerMN domain-containing protein [Clostridium tarantellae]|uniref:GerMN domain-containing protein n=1 Tax=Clostridium tarantellae TaxID=39493 RepID=A0A6I1MJA6_9CLOT|nr:GerMN domain-containing protein [Clostridium tarantellae]MPQ43616.1 hypothetical protein [Clostridium tarantellae]
MKFKANFFKILVLVTLPIFLMGCIIVKNEPSSPNVPDDKIIEPSKPTNPNDSNKPTKPDGSNKPTKPDDSNKPTNPPKDPIIESRIYRLFYYDSNYNIYYVDKKVNLVDNAIIKTLSKELQTPPNKNLNKVFYPKVSVKSAKVSNDILKVDLSKEFYSEINLGSGSESCMFQCLTNTYGYNLNVKKVIITIEGKNYASGHILMEDGDYFTVDYSNVKPLK